jgi:hypothetical protein
MDVPIREAHTTTGLRWPLVPWFLPFWYAGLAAGWWHASTQDLAVAERSGASGSSLALVLALAGKLTAWLTESAFYHSFWKARGRRLPFWRFFCVVASASTADLLARVIAESIHRHLALGPSLAWVAGAQLAKGPAWLSTPALRTMFGTLGLLTVVRLSMTAQAQRAALGLSFARALAWTAFFWLLTRIALFFTFDLMTGMSPLPQG